MKLSSMGITETKYKKLEMLKPAYYEKLKNSAGEVERKEIRERERWKRYNQNYYYKSQKQKREEEIQQLDKTNLHKIGSGN